MDASEIWGSSGIRLWPPLFHYLYVNDIQTVINHSKHGMFADDLREVGTHTDCELLRDDLVRVILWSSQFC